MRCWNSRVSGAALGTLPKILIYSFCNCARVWVLSQSVHWKRPKGTTRQTTLLTTFTQTAKAAQCRHSTGAPTPALNRSRKSLLAGRSCVGTIARCSQALVLQTDSLFFFLPICFLSALRSETRSDDELKTLHKPFQATFFLHAIFMSVLL